MSPVYYKIYHWDKIDKVSVVCLQDLDEYKYDANAFYKGYYGEDTVFDTEEEAIKFINSTFKPEYIDPEYLINHEDFFKKAKV